ncbi:MAG TPA: large-conductance mechanosensitive channel protein MscL [Gemmatimonadales bacterium]|nr:large-conductance mechanosensitive channel protein MscL [Gemmatimonadales bacterium]
MSFECSSMVQEGRLRNPPARPALPRPPVCVYFLPVGSDPPNQGGDMLKEFKAFAMRGNVLDLAVGFIMGGAFGTIVKSLVDDVIMPPIGLALGNVDFSNLFVVLKQGAKAPPPYSTIADAHAAGAVTLNYGTFINTVIAFLIVAFAVFLLVRAANRMMPAEAEAPNTKDCPYCRMAIPVAASRCPQCTSDLRAA